MTLLPAVLSGEAMTAAPLINTFQALATTANPHAGELLVAALDVPIPAIQHEAIQSVIGRGGVREQMEAVRRYLRFDPECRLVLEESAAQIIPAIRQCLILGRGDLEYAALELASQGEAFGIIETLLELLRSDRSDLHEEVVSTLRHLVNRLYEHLRGSQGDKPPLKNVGQVQQLTLMALDQALVQFSSLVYADVVLESVLALAGAGHPQALKLLNQGRVEYRALARELLLTSRHPGVMRFLLDSLGKPYPPARVFDAIQERDDPEFVLATLRWVPKRWSATQERNLRQIEKIAWLQGGTEPLELIPDELQAALVTFSTATGLSREDKLAIRQWVVRHGCPAARDAASAVLEELDAETAQEIVLDGLDSDDPNVQAWATAHLRSQHVPDALAKLIDRLDSPEACVQAVARQELKGFDLDCLLSRFETMSPRARENAGQLLEKIDPNCLPRLTQEFQHSIRRRRIRAIRGALAYGWHLKVLPSLLAMLKDEDSLIRRTAIEVLAHVHTPEVVASLLALKDDPSERVRDTLEHALTQLAEAAPVEVPSETHHPSERVS